MKRSILLTLALCACSSSSATLIDASEGGAVTTGTHDIVIPPASLTEDTEVVVRTGDISSYLPLTDAHSEVLLLEPAGTVLEVAAQVTVHDRFIDAEEGDRVAIYQFDDRPDGGWIPRESIVTELGRQISITRFAPIAVVVEAAPDGAAAIQGTLIWSGSGEPATGAPLELRRDDSVLTSTVTDGEGRFNFADLEPGTYTVTTDFECSLSETLTLADGEVAQPTFALCGPRPD